MVQSAVVSSLSSMLPRCRYVVVQGLILSCFTPLLCRECAEAGPDVVLDGVASLLQSISACGAVAQHFLSQPQWLTLLAALTHSGPLQVQRRGLRVLHRVVPAIRPVHVRRHMHIHKRMA